VNAIGVAARLDLLSLEKGGWGGKTKKKRGKRGNLL
jgi:hypothetical protein